MVMEVVHEDLGEGNMGCGNHQYKNSTPGGICAFCLQEKLGKLVSSSFPVSVFPSSSSSSTPSFRSDYDGGSTATTRRLASNSSSHSQFRNYIDTTRGADSSCLGYHSVRKSRLAFILTHGRQRQKDEMMTCSNSNSIIYKRSMSTTPGRGFHHKDHSHRTKFWPFLHMPKISTNKTTTIHSKPVNSSTAIPRTMSISSSSRYRKKEDFLAVDETEAGSPDEAAFDRKVSRSRSVGCGSRSFSGDFFDKISTGFGDCTLRRAESQREANPKAPSVRNIGYTQRVKCGGMFSGFMTPSSSSSSSTEDKSIAATQSSIGNLSHGRTRSWGWALASPMRALGKAAF
ncbi:hypothetical protein F511_26478 [Dorcoceras hygrometricum]|uniref:Uncharacterized protein n=1 Tax=Dorcoceras hygrometricum TaxID=472368 RepID=A0A2Z7AZG4_9LAMI|nr:hypothetical protein F511_26478 [Dorcoceras hygrometricum]